MKNKKIIVLVIALIAIIVVTVIVVLNNKKTESNVNPENVENAETPKITVDGPSLDIEGETIATKIQIYNKEGNIRSRY